MGSVVKGFDLFSMARPAYLVSDIARARDPCVVWLGGDR
jgi:prophage tail gpP-like protein